MLGICNGFQILCEAGLLPGVLRPNASLSFVCRDVAVRVERVAPPFTSRCEHGQRLVIPVKHGEGCWYAPPELVEELERAGQIVLRYERARTRTARSPTSPASSTTEGNVMGLMPHPEHAVDPLLGSGDGAMILASLVDAARERMPVAPPRHLPSPSAAASSGCFASSLRSFSRSRARNVTGPRRAEPSVV